jgi:hypothetical protein
MTEKATRIDCRGCNGMIQGCWDEHPFHCYRDEGERTPVVIKKQEKSCNVYVHNNTNPLVSPCGICKDANNEDKKARDDFKALLVDIIFNLNHDYANNIGLIIRIQTAIERLEDK